MVAEQATRSPAQEAPSRCRHHRTALDRVEVSFDDDRLVADAGLMLAATLSQHLGLKDLLDRHVDLGGAPGRANVGHKAMTVVHSVLAGGDCIDDAAGLQAGGTEEILGHELRAPSTLGRSCAPLPSATRGSWTR